MLSTIFMFAFLFVLMITLLISLYNKNLSMNKLSKYSLTASLTLFLFYLLYAFIIEFSKPNFKYDVLTKFILILLIFLAFLFFFAYNLYTSRKLSNLLMFIVTLIFGITIYFEQPKLTTLNIKISYQDNNSEETIELKLDNGYKAKGVGPWHTYFYSDLPLDGMKQAFKDQIGMTNSTNDGISYTYQKDGNDYHIILRLENGQKVFLRNGFLEANKYSIIITRTL